MPAADAMLLLALLLLRVLLLAALLSKTV